MKLTSEELYERARKRVNGSLTLHPHFNFILCSDFPEGDDHYRWVATAKISEIMDWVLTCEAVDAEIHDPDLQ